jgi:hypothetical protein
MIVQDRPQEGPYRHFMVKIVASELSNSKRVTERIFSKKQKQS